MFTILPSLGVEGRGRGGRGYNKRITMSKNIMISVDIRHPSLYLSLYTHTQIYIYISYQFYAIGT